MVSNIIFWKTQQRRYTANLYQFRGKDGYRGMLSKGVISHSLPIKETFLSNSFLAKIKDEGK